MAALSKEVDMFQEDINKVREIACGIAKEEFSKAIGNFEKKIIEINQAGMKEAEIRAEKAMLAISNELSKRIEKLEQEISTLKSPAKVTKKEVK